MLCYLILGMLYWLEVTTNFTQTITSPVGYTISWTVVGIFYQLDTTTPIPGWTVVDPVQYALSWIGLGLLFWFDVANHTSPAISLPARYAVSWMCLGFLVWIDTMSHIQRIFSPPTSFPVAWIGLGLFYLLDGASNISNTFVVLLRDSTAYQASWILSALLICQDVIDFVVHTFHVTDGPPAAFNPFTVFSTPSITAAAAISTTMIAVASPISTIAEAISITIIAEAIPIALITEATPITIIAEATPTSIATEAIKLYDYDIFSPLDDSH